MRYTTIIDLSEWPSLYRSESVRLVYLHLCLKAGYHDHDRDLCNTSIRRLSADTGLSMSATRCALKRLMDARLLTKQGNLYYVAKYVMDSPITPRARTQRQQKAIERRAAEEQEREERQRRMMIDEQRRLNLRSQGKTPFMLYVEDLQQKAAAGDPEAARLYKTHQAAYQAHLASLAQDKQDDNTNPQKSK